MNLRYNLEHGIKIVELFAKFPLSDDHGGIEGTGNYHETGIPAADCLLHRSAQSHTRMYSFQCKQ
jgi:hypothetical protein